MDSDLSAAAHLIEDIRHLTDSTIYAVQTLITRPESNALALAYDESQSLSKRDLGFNIFAIISDLYYRETFHSDLLFALLDPKCPHGDGAKYLQLFLQFIRSKANGFRIDAAQYRNAKVTKEKGHIDLLIQDPVSKRAVIIENKINDAPDQKKQLLRYLRHVENDLECECDGIVYLRLNREQRPDQQGWSDKDKADVNARLIFVSAFDRTENDLVSGWLRPAEDAAHSADAKVILRQYSELLIHLGSTAMNKLLMKQFYDLMLQGNNLGVALSLREMLDELAHFRSDRILDEFKNDLHPFQNIGHYQFRSAYFDQVPYEKGELALDVWIEPDANVLEFWDRKDEEHEKGTAKRLLQKMGIASDFKRNGRGFQKRIPFPGQESELFDEIRAFKSNLARVLGLPPNRLRCFD